ncbi:hypothetical protein EP51_46730 (plasmid) [Rhodococcus opacus]|uniref:DUF2510 domain-containing protein n=2 Tax=Rhodococcus opacus TaxID=37919 RepID=A0A076F723_RHOOP|nr:hypothetical protein EP51_46730 [Rhodococcus opacus]
MLVCAAFAVMLAIIIGVIVLIVRVVKSRNTAATAHPMPPGWYPDTTDARLIRWHDGHRWTDHVQNR